MRRALMLLAALSLVALVIWMRHHSPDLIVAAQKSVPDEPPRLLAHQIIDGSIPQAPALPIETEQQRLQRQRELYLQLYPRLGEVLEIDAKTEGKLYDLLAKQGMDPRGGEWDTADVQDQVASENDVQLETLVGERAFSRFEQYRSMPASRDVARLNATFDETNRIRGEAIWQLAKLIHENSIHGSKSLISSSSYQTLPPEVEGSARSQMLISLAQQQDHFRMQEGWRNRIETEAASFLTPEQLDALKRSRAETSQSWRRGIESLRAEVGLAPAIPETPEATLLGIIRRRIPVPGEIESELILTVNGESVHIEHIGHNRERFNFQAGSNLQVEAIATLYDDDWLEMLLAYSETRGGKPRQLDQWVMIGSPTRHKDGARSAPHDAGLETHRGRMEYHIRPTGITAAIVETRR